MLSVQVSILQLGDGLVSAPLWNSLLSTCPVLSWTKNVFGNQFVLEKGEETSIVITNFGWNKHYRESVRSNNR